jgi:chemotaxis protein methyltransferase CheR
MLVLHEFQLSDDDFKVVQQAVHAYCGIALNNEKKAMVRGRLTRHIRAGGFGSTAEYLDHVLADPRSVAFAEFIDAISTNLTSFFREAGHFKHLSGTVLPKLLAGKEDRGEGRILAWSAACSSGEEPYSMAMTMLDCIRQRPRGPVNWDLRILANDISTRMLAAARAGIYSQTAIQGIPSSYKPQYFTLASARDGHDNCYQISPELRRVVRFRNLNLIDPWPFSGPFDVIFCRNVMIYFDQATQQRLVERFTDCLRVGGYLFTGHSESLGGIDHRLAPCQPSIYEKIE